ncbi:MAG TPA: hypothetical protein VLE91_04275 [Candidatus Saccharimonadales bacterium]|nr:hypothetical protein [Candidatus Saccharimonadales bacterium]
MRSGFVGILLLFIIVGAVWYAYHYYIQLPAVVPNKLNVNAVSNIPRFPQADYWSVEYKKDICVVPKEACIHSAKISFETTDPWTNIYEFYIKKMNENGWQTSSTIVTSIPTKPLFTSGDCEAYIGKKESILPFVSSGKDTQYQVNISCKG